MNWNKLARWAGVTAFSAIIPAAAMAKAHHTRLTHATTAPSGLTSRHVKPVASKKAVASKLKTHGIKAKPLMTTKHKTVVLKSKKRIAGKLVAHKSAASKLTVRKHVSAKLTGTKAKVHTLTSHKVAAKPAVKTVRTVAPTM